MKRAIFCWTLLLVGLQALPALAQPGMFGELTPLRIDSARILEERALAIDAGVALESDREIRTGAEYDNVRLAPLGVRYGLGQEFEVGGSLAFSANDGDNGGPDESGLEGLSLFGKLGLNAYSALKFGLTFGGDDEINPDPNDGLDLFVNLPLRRYLGIGLLYGEFGYTLQDDDIGGSYFNYGAGYAVTVQPGFSLNVELVGDEAHARVGNQLDLVIGGNLFLRNSVRIAPYLSLGLYDASPDVALGAVLELRL